MFKVYLFSHVNWLNAKCNVLQMPCHNFEYFKICQSFIQFNIQYHNSLSKVHDMDFYLELLYSHLKESIYILLRMCSRFFMMS